MIENDYERNPAIEHVVDDIVDAAREYLLTPSEETFRDYIHLLINSITIIKDEL